MGTCDSSVGNSAAMREALVELLDAMYDMGIDEETVSIAAESPNCHMHSVELLSVIKKAKAALAAPPRNCDVPEVAEGQPINLTEQAWRVFKRSHKDAYPDAYGLLRCIDWLLAPATAKEGDSNAQGTTRHARKEARSDTE